MLTATGAVVLVVKKRMAPPKLRSCGSKEGRRRNRDRTFASQRFLYIRWLRCGSAAGRI